MRFAAGRGGFGGGLATPATGAPTGALAWFVPEEYPFAAVAASLRGGCAGYLAMDRAQRRAELSRVYTAIAERPVDLGDAAHDGLFARMDAGLSAYCAANGVLSAPVAVASSTAVSVVPPDGQLEQVVSTSPAPARPRSMTPFDQIDLAPAPLAATPPPLGTVGVLMPQGALRPPAGQAYYNYNISKGGSGLGTPTSFEGSGLLETSAVVRALGAMGGCARFLAADVAQRYLLLQSAAAIAAGRPVRLSSGGLADLDARVRAYCAAGQGFSVPTAPLRRGVLYAAGQADAALPPAVPTAPVPSSGSSISVPLALGVGAAVAATAALAYYLSRPTPQPAVATARRPRRRTRR